MTQAECGDPGYTGYRVLERLGGLAPRVVGRRGLQLLLGSQRHGGERDRLPESSGGELPQPALHPPERAVNHVINEVGVGRGGELLVLSNEGTAWTQFEPARLKTGQRTGKRRVVPPMPTGELEDHQTAGARMHGMPSARCSFRLACSSIEMVMECALAPLSSLASD